VQERTEDAAVRAIAVSYALVAITLLCGTFVSTVTIIPFMPNGWDPTAGFPAMAGNVPFLMKDVVLLAVSTYLLKQDVMRVSLSAGRAGDTKPAAGVVTAASAAAANR
jgi:uncharacterized membrane protein YkgB